MSKIACSNENGEKLVKIVNSAKLILLWRTWPKFAKIVKSMKIHLLLTKFRQICRLFTARISGYKWFIFFLQYQAYKGAKLGWIQKIPLVMWLERYFEFLWVISLSYSESVSKEINAKQLQSNAKIEEFHRWATNSVPFVFKERLWGPKGCFYC